MTKEKRAAIWSLFAIAVGIGGILLSIFLHRPSSQLVLTGVVLRDDADPQKQQPIPNAEITAGDGLSLGSAKSDVAGLFHLKLAPSVKRGQLVTLEFRSPEYQAVVSPQKAGDEILVARMLPIARQVRVRPNHPDIKISEVKVRYSTKAMTTVNVATAVRTFEVSNVGNVPCINTLPCSPDGKWKASIVSQVLDAGDGNQFKSERVSCIAGPCPFTRIESETASREGREFKVSVRNWSDTATFLIEAEVTHTMVSDIVRQLYPAIVGEAMNFSTPASAQGLSLQAEVDGSSVVFPIGPTLSLSWAACTLQTAADQSKLYQCELKPGYVFQ